MAHSACHPQRMKSQIKHNTLVFSDRITILYFPTTTFCTTIFRFLSPTKIFNYPAVKRATKGVIWRGREFRAFRKEMLVKYAEEG